MSNGPRDELLQSIECYAASKTTDNDLLKRLATQHLAQTLGKMDIVAPANIPKELLEQALDPINESIEF